MANLCRIFGGIWTMVGKNNRIDLGQCNESQTMLIGSERESDSQTAREALSGVSDGNGNLVPLGRSEQAEIGRKLRDIYYGVAAEPLPKNVADALVELEQKLREIKDDGPPG